MRAELLCLSRVLLSLIKRLLNLLVSAGLSVVAGSFSRTINWVGGVHFRIRFFLPDKIVEQHFIEVSPLKLPWLVNRGLIQHANIH